MLDHVKGLAPIRATVITKQCRELVIDMAGRQIIFVNFLSVPSL